VATTAPPASDLLPALKALADPTRLELLRLLAAGERCVCELHGPLELAPNLASHHLRVLREAGLVSVRRDSRWAYYSLERERLESLWGDLSTWLESAPPLPPARCG
jgi:ArsR family transcriptional regulator, arsenate/arsenite/antimonite-responsive transcriptional repressor